MPYEMRRLYFSEAEVAKAILAFNAQSRQKFLTPGGLDGIRLYADPDLHIEITVETVAGDRETVVVNETMVAAAIIRYCINMRVPLPLHSTKSLKLVNGQLVFDISLPRDHELFAGATRVAAAG